MSRALVETTVKEKECRGELELRGRRGRDQPAGSSGLFLPSSRELYLKGKLKALPPYYQ